MTEISLRTLMIAIGSMVADRERILARIAKEGAEVDSEERLSELVMDIDSSLSELADAYEDQRKTAPGYPAYGDLVAQMSQSRNGAAD
jgi:hypothetical protein